MIDDFKILQVLGEGAFGVVYLAEQISLGRKVALKITSDRGEEARTMASLEHENIVRVFSETRDSEQGFRLICMQYVPGPTLAEVIDYLNRHDPNVWSGKLFIQAVDELSKGSTTLDPVALRDREYLRQADFPTVVAWIGARLAEALEVAHSNRVLHRDIKPANILLNQYGRPLLADFSLSFQTEKIEAGSDVLFGGTLAYMAPEHLEAFNPSHDTGPDQVDERSDLYSLAIVLYEFLSGKRAFEPKRTGGDRLEELQLLTEERKEGLPELPSDLKDQKIRASSKFTSGGGWRSPKKVSHFTRVGAVFRRGHRFKNDATKVS